MKPINLKISAFGPYKDIVEINFETLGESGIFLITGDTGAGKTTIFDAISFALFGGVSGSNRTVQSLRSNFAEQDKPTFVEFKFSHKNHIYKINRNPAYERTKKRGEGSTTTSADSFIEFDTGDVLTGFSAVTEKVEEILGINEKQFKQIAMLAQGEFIKILFADSKERTEIFRRIFDTNIFNKITKKLEALQKDEKGKLLELQSSFVAKTSAVVLESEKIEEVQAKNVNELYISEVLEKLENEIKVNAKVYSQIEAEVKKSEETQKILSENLTKKEEQNSKLDELEKQKRLREELNKKSKEIEEKNALLKNSQEILAKVLPKEEKVVEAQKEISKVDAELKLLEKEIENGKNLEIKVKEQAENLEIIKQELQKYNDCQASNNEIEVNLNKSRQIVKLQRDQEKDIDNYKILETEYKNLNSEYIEKEDEFFREQAGILAEKLEEDKPCPVCRKFDSPTNRL
jgi:exonuclease SbcC